jgi:hypothetical protein
MSSIGTGGKVLFHSARSDGPGWTFGLDKNIIRRQEIRQYKVPGTNVTHRSYTRRKTKNWFNKSSRSTLSVWCGLVVKPKHSALRQLCFHWQRILPHAVSASAIPRRTRRRRGWTVVSKNTSKRFAAGYSKKLQFKMVLKTKLVKQAGFSSVSHWFIFFNHSIGEDYE